MPTRVCLHVAPQQRPLLPEVPGQRGRLVGAGGRHQRQRAPQVPQQLVCLQSLAAQVLLRMGDGSDVVSNGSDVVSKASL